MVAAGPRLKSCDREQRIERLDQAVGLLDGALQRLAIGGLAVRLAQGGLNTVAQAVQRRLEIVSNIVGDLAQARHQLLDPRQHEIEAPRQAVKLIARTIHGQAAGEVPFHDGARGGGDRIDPRQQFAAHPIAAADPEQRHDAQPPQHGRSDQPREFAAILDIASDDEAIAAGQPEDVGEGKPGLDTARGRTAVDELDGPEATGELR